MKQLFTILCLFISLNAFSKIIRVNNQEPTNPQQSTYNNLQDAYDNAQAGDTLYIEGSTEDYGRLEISKKVTLIGPGYFLADNLNTQANSQSAILHIVTLENGSEGSKLIGLSVSKESFSEVRLNVNNIEIKKCYFGNGAEIALNKGLLQNIIISQNFFESQPITIDSFREAAINLFFSNNIVLGEFKLKNNTTGTVINNVFVNGTFDVGSNSVLSMHNNILLGTNTSEVVLPAPQSSITHNIAALNQFGTDNNNQANVATTDIFTGGDSPDGKYVIKTNGPADNKGRNGVDIGAFGGPDPYRLSGIPDIPHIYELTTDGFATKEGELRVQIKVTAN